MARHRVQQQQAYVLHRRPYSESSLLLEIFSARYGRLGLLAKGARRLKSANRGLLLPFQLLRLSWSGRGELPVLTGAEFEKRERPLSSEFLLSGFYLNELLVRLIHRHDSVPEIFAHYQHALMGLRADPVALEATLRCFELRLLNSMGYGISVTHDANSGKPIAADQQYDYVPERGPVAICSLNAGSSNAGSSNTDSSNASSLNEASLPVSGNTLLALGCEDFSNANVRRQSKYLLRELLGNQLDGRRLRSRKLVYSVQQHLRSKGSAQEHNDSPRNEADSNLISRSEDQHTAAG